MIEREGGKEGERERERGGGGIVSKDTFGAFCCFLRASFLHVYFP